MTQRYNKIGLHTLFIITFIIMKILTLLLFTLIISLTSCNNTKDSRIKTSIRQQIAIYPKSTLCDIYKSFFQDRFGPGHLISDTTTAGIYLRKELSTMNESFIADYEPTGCEGNFYRVNLSVLKDGRIPYEVYFNTFVKSVSIIENNSIEKWKTEWKHILTIIDELSLDLHNYENDKILIDSMLNENKYVIHHSREYNTAYKPHYRIMKKSLFEKEILPLLNDNKH